MKLLNPHKHIDGIPNYIVIMTLVNCDNKGNPYMLAMYSEKPLSLNEKNDHNNKGFIASVSNQKVFYLLKSNKNARYTEYNEYYLTYGNM
jgi:hypothetical protein